MIKNKITPFLWFDKGAMEAAKFYISVFDDVRINSSRKIEGTPSGTVEIIDIEILGYKFNFMSAGPYFKFTPAISFFVNFDPSQDKESVKKIDVVWNRLLNGGKILMPIQKYPFSERYGWIQDKYGVSWQLILTSPAGNKRPKVAPCFLFMGNSYGKAEESVKFYLSVFSDSKLGNLLHYGTGQEPNKEGTVMFSDFKLFNSWFAAMDGEGQHAFTFNEAISFVVSCEDQKEVDYYWNKLSEGGQESQCGWLKDKFGISWQIVPTALPKLMSDKDKNKAGRVTQAMLQMKKIDIKELEKAYEWK